MRNSEEYCLINVCSWFAIISKFTIFFLCRFEWQSGGHIYSGGGVGVV